MQGLSAAHPLEAPHPVRTPTMRTMSWWSSWWLTPRAGKVSGAFLQPMANRWRDVRAAGGPDMDQPGRRPDAGTGAGTQVLALAPPRYPCYPSPDEEPGYRRWRLRPVRSRLTPPGAERRAAETKDSQAGKGTTARKPRPPWRGFTPPSRPPSTGTPLRWSPASVRPVRPNWPCGPAPTSHPLPPSPDGTGKRARHERPE